MVPIQLNPTLVRNGARFAAVVAAIAVGHLEAAATSGATDDADLPPDLFAQVQAEAATTWRAPATASAHLVRGSDRLRAWCAGFSLHAGVVLAGHDHEALERPCRYAARPAFAHDRPDRRPPDACGSRSPPTPPTPASPSQALASEPALVFPGRDAGE